MQLWPRLSGLQNHACTKAAFGSLLPMDCKKSHCPHILNRSLLPILQGFLDITRLALEVMTVAQAAYIVAIFACLYAAQAATLIQNVISINGTYQQSAALPAVCVLVGSSSCWGIHDDQPV